MPNPPSEPVDNPVENYRTTASPTASPTASQTPPGHSEIECVPSSPLPSGGTHSSSPRGTQSTTASPDRVPTDRIDQIKQAQTALLLHAAQVAQITGGAPGTLAVLDGSPRWRSLCAELDRLEDRR